MSDFQIPLLSTFVGFLADIMRVCLEFCYKFTNDMGFPSYGIAIIVLTVIIKTLLLPFALKQIKSMKAMQEIQPEMQRIQKKYKNDPNKLREEMGKLYKEHGASPLAGCLPLLIQMPFLVSIYYALQGFAYDPAHESFLWLQSLAVPDSTYILPILSAASTFVISWQTTPKDAPGNQKTMLLLMPIMIGWMSLNFPSGLVIYWIVGVSKKGVLTVHNHEDEDEVKTEEPKKKKVIRKRVIKKVVKKKEPEAAEKAESEEQAEVAPKADAPKEETKEEKKAPEASPEAEDKKNNDKKPGEADETK